VSLAPWVPSSASSASDAAAFLRLMGVVWRVSASRAFHTLLVYTSACAQAETKLGNPLGEHVGLALSPSGPGSIHAPELTQSFVLPTSYLTSFTIHSC
jgi:hypothetical protein